MSVVKFSLVQKKAQLSDV